MRSDLLELYRMTTEFAVGEVSGPRYDRVYTPIDDRRYTHEEAEREARRREDERRRVAKLTDDDDAWWQTGFTPIVLDNDVWREVDRTRDWIFDAVENHPWTDLRLPLVAGTYPRYFYHVALAVPLDDRGTLDHAVWPTDGEARLLAAFNQFFIEEMYRSSYVSKLRERRLDVDSGVNTINVVKTEHGGWKFRRMTWRSGPALYPMPQVGAGERDFTHLEELLDHLQKGYDQPLRDPYAAWKATVPTLLDAAR